MVATDDGVGTAIECDELLAEPAGDSVLNTAFLDLELVALAAEMAPSGGGCVCLTGLGNSPDEGLALL